MYQYTYTPIMNAFYEILDCEFAKASRYGIKVTLFFVKLDHMVEIVGKHGQLTAKRMLMDIHHIISQNIRHGDREFIYGSDELMIILPNTPKAHAHYLIAKLKRLIEDYTYIDDNNVCLKLSPRFGISSYPLDVDTDEE